MSRVRTGDRYGFGPTCDAYVAMYEAGLVAVIHLPPMYAWSLRVVSC